MSKKSAFSGFGGRQRTGKHPFLGSAARLLLTFGLIASSALASFAVAPVLSPPSDLTILEDAGRTNLSFVVTDADTPFYVVSVTARSSNTNLVPNANLAVVGSGTTRTLGITTRANISGSATISLIADDGATKVTNSFALSVTAVNDAPVLGALTNMTVLEDFAPVKRSVLLTDVDTPIGFVTLSATSSDTNLVALALTGSTTNRTLTLSPLTNANGTATITLVANDGSKTATNSFSLTVTPVNDAPIIASLSAFTMVEDAAATNRTVLVTDVDTAITNVTLTASANTNLVTVSVSGTATNRTLTLTPVANAFGTTPVTLIANDGAKSSTNTFTLTVSPVNDIPSFTLATNVVSVSEDSATYSVTNFATSISSGPSNESSQTNLFVLTVTNTAFFATQPAISPAGTLTFRPATNANGTNTITVAMRDSGGTTNGGVNTSASTTFSIVVNAVNDAPVLAGLSNFTIKEDYGTTNRTFVVNDLDTTISAVTVSADSSDTNLVNVSVTGTATNRTLVITTVTNANGSATITVVADDGAATATNSFVLTVTPVNDTPGFTLTTNLITIGEDSGVYTLNNFATNMTSGPSDESTQTNFFVVTVTNAAFFATAPVISPSGTLTFKPGTNKFGTNTVSVVIKDSGGTNLGGINTSAAQSFQVAFTTINDAPVIGTLTALTINEDAGRTNRAVSLTDADTVITNVTLTATSSDTNLINVSLAGTTTNRTLSITTVTNANGSATVTLVADDGIDTTTNSFSVMVTAVNDAPVMAALTALSVPEDSGATNRTVLLSDVDTPATNITVTAFSANTNVATVSISGTDTNRTLTITPVTNAFGTSTIRLIADDGAKTATNTFVLTVTSVNDVPGFALSTNAVTVAEDSGLYTLPAFATSITSGPTNESTQTNLFVLTVTNTAFFATQPVITPTGTLSFKPNTNINGTNTISVVIRDSGGTTNGGVNTSAAQTFDIIVTAGNDAPVIGTLSALTIKEDLGTTNRTVVVTDVDTTISSVTVSADSSDTNIVTVGISGTTTNRTLAITTVTNANGSATITLIADDGAATTTNSFVVTVTAVNDAPSFTLTTNLVTVVEDSGVFSLSNFATNISNGPSDESAQTNNFVVTVTNAAFFATAPTISSAGTLSFKPGTNKFGTNTISVVLRDSGGTNTGGANTSVAHTFQIAITTANDAPVIGTIASFSINEDLGRTNKAVSLTDVDTVITNVTLTATSSDTNLVTVSLAGTTTNRTLSMVTVTNANGSATITLVADDGTDTTTNSFTLTVNAVNDAPVLAAMPALTVLEDSAATNLTVIVSDVDTDVTNVTVTAASANTNIATVSISGTDTNRTLTITPVTNAFGTSTITLIADDGAKSSTNTFVLTVSSVNDIPSFALSTNAVTVAEDNGLYTLSGFATSISSGPSNESTQTNTFVLTVTNSAFFATQPAISPAGALSFRPAANANGTNTISVVIRDSGGTTNGGVNTSAAQTFDIIVTAVNDAPLISGITAFTIREDYGTTNRTFSVSDVDTALGSVTVTATSSDTNLVTVGTTGSSTNRTLDVTTVSNAFGTATITLVADDGAATSTNSIVLTVSPVNDAPSFTLSSNNVTITKLSTSVTVTNFVTNMVAGPSNENTQTWSFIVTTTNSTFFVTQPSITTNGTLTFKAKDNAGSAIVSVKMQDNGGTNLGGVNLSAAQTFTVTVPANPYIPLSGEYNGLFFDTNGVLNSSAGFMNFTLTNNGTFNGYVLMDGGSNTFTGQFDLAGDATATITRTNGDLAVTMLMDLTTNFSESASGTVSNGSWTAILTVDHAQFSSGFNPAPQQGAYTLQLPGSVTPATLPGGDGWATVSVSDAGIATLNGQLSDGTAITQSVSISKDGAWPLYIPLYGGKGCLLSWVTFTNDAASDLSGNATWIKDSTAGGSYYTSGFTNDLTITGSYYDVPPFGWPVLDLSSATVTLSGGDLSTPITNLVTLNWDNTITVDPSATNGLALTIDLSNGTFTGEFIDPVSLNTNQLQGVVLQTSTNAAGFFLGTSQSGSIRLQ